METWWTLVDLPYHSLVRKFTDYYFAQLHSISGKVLIFKGPIYCLPCCASVFPKRVRSCKIYGPYLNLTVRIALIFQLEYEQENFGVFWSCWNPINASSKGIDDNNNGWFLWRCPQFQHVCSEKVQTSDIGSVLMKIILYQWYICIIMTQEF